MFEKKTTNGCFNILQTTSEKEPGSFFRKKTISVKKSEEEDGKLLSDTKEEDRSTKDIDTKEGLTNSIKKYLNDPRKHGILTELCALCQNFEFEIDSFCDEYLKLINEEEGLELRWPTREAFETPELLFIHYLKHRTYLKHIGVMKELKVQSYVLSAIKTVEEGELVETVEEFPLTAKNSRQYYATNNTVTVIECRDKLKTRKIITHHARIQLNISSILSYILNPFETIRNDENSRKGSRGPHLLSNWIKYEPQHYRMNLGNFEKFRILEHIRSILSNILSPMKTVRNEENTRKDTRRPRLFTEWNKTVPDQEPKMKPIHYKPSNYAHGFQTRITKAIYNTKKILRLP